MKRIIALVQPSSVLAIREALIDAGAQGLTVNEALGGGQAWPPYRVRGAFEPLAPMIRIEVLTQTEAAPRLIEAILSAFPQGSRRERGKIFVAAVEEVIRIRTQEINGAALS